MIPVQLASEITGNGVIGNRWVLIESPGAEGPEAAATSTATTAPATATLAMAESPSAGAGHGSAAQAPSAALASQRGMALLNGLKALVMALGLGAAMWTANADMGAPTVRWWAPSDGAEPAAVPRAVDAGASLATSVVTNEGATPAANPAPQAMGRTAPAPAFAERAR